MGKATLGERSANVVGVRIVQQEHGMTCRRTYSVEANHLRGCPLSSSSSSAPFVLPKVVTSMMDSRSVRPSTCSDRRRRDDALTAIPKLTTNGIKNVPLCDRELLLDLNLHNDERSILVVVGRSGPGVQRSQALGEVITGIGVVKTRAMTHRNNELTSISIRIIRTTSSGVSQRRATCWDRFFVCSCCGCQSPEHDATEDCLGLGR